MYTEQITGTAGPGLHTATHPALDVVGAVLVALGRAVGTLLRVTFKIACVAVVLAFRFLLFAWRVGVRFLEAL